jgi:5'-3' exonuclease
VSSDSDFIQLLNAFEENFRIYNPVKKIFVEKPEYDYVTWKALRGDKTDNISGIPGIGDKTAEKLCKNEMLLQETLSNPIKRDVFERNVNLIRLVDFSNTLDQVESHVGNANFDKLQETFEKMEFTSMIKEKTWQKYCNTFKNL